MNVDDETLLTAYLDGELGPEGQRRVETALGEQPGLSEQLHELSTVRSLVRGLSRPAIPRDITAEVLSGLTSWRPRRARSFLADPAYRMRVLSTGAGLAAAAALLVVLAHSLRPPVANAPAVAGLKPDLVGSRPEFPSPRPAPAAVNAPGPSPEIVVATPSPAGPASGESFADREMLRTLLDQNSVRIVRATVGAIDPATLKSIEGAIDETSPADPLRGRIRIDPGLVVDPARPEESVVYLLVLDARELAGLEANLRPRVLTGPSPPVDAPPEIVTQLADVGQARVEQDSRAPASELRRLPPDLAGRRLALKNRSEGAVGSVRTGQEAETTGNEAVTVPSAPGPVEDSTHLYLIWIAASQAAGKSQP